MLSFVFPESTQRSEAVISVFYPPLFTNLGIQARLTNLDLELLLIGYLMWAAAKCIHVLWNVYLVEKYSLSRHIVWLVEQWSSSYCWVGNSTHLMSQKSSKILFDCGFPPMCILQYFQTALIYNSKGYRMFPPKNRIVEHITGLVSFSKCRRTTHERWDTRVSCSGHDCRI